MKPVLAPLFAFSMLVCGLMPALLAAQADKEPAPPAPGADKATDYSAPRRLKRQTLAKLPPLWKLGEGDGTKAYEAVLAFHKENKKALEEIDGVPAPLADRALDLLIKAIETGPPSRAFFDSHEPMKPFAGPAFGDGFQVVVEVAALRAEELHQRDNPAHRQRAMLGTRAIVALGTLMFEQSDRVPIKTGGLSNITCGLTLLYNWTDENTQEGKDVIAWTNAIDDLITDHWRSKSEVVYSLRLKTPDLPATIGDAINIARNDEDAAWRIEAVLALARLKFTRGLGAGNRAAITATLEELVKSDDKRIAEAAKVARKFTAEDVRKLN